MKYELDKYKTQVQVELNSIKQDPSNCLIPSLINIKQRYTVIICVSRLNTVDKRQYILCHAFTISG